MAHRLTGALERHHEASQPPDQPSLNVASVRVAPDQPRAMDDLLAEADALMHAPKRARKLPRV